MLAAVTTRAARDSHDAHAWQLACSTAAALEFTGHWQQHLTLLRAGLRVAEHASHPGGQAHTHHHLGRALITGGQPGTALAHLHQAMDLFGQLADALNQADTHLTLAVAFDQLGQPARSLSHAQHALGLYQHAGHIPGQAIALTNICWNQALLGQHQQALTAATRALQLTRQTRHPVMWQAAVLDTIGYIHHQLGDHATALRHYQQALHHNNNGGGNPRLQATILTHLSDTYHATGNDTAAQTTRNQAATILGQLQHPGGSAPYAGSQA